VQDIAPTFQMIVAIAAVVTPTVLFARWVRGDESVSIASLFYMASRDESWPRGVQEEEPVHFVFGAAGPGASAVERRDGEQVRELLAPDQDAAGPGHVRPGRHAHVEAAVRGPQAPDLDGRGVVSGAVG
jgi:hypothetical protein